MRQESRDALRENDADLTAPLGIMHYPPGGTPPPPPLPGGRCPSITTSGTRPRRGRASAALRSQRPR